MSNSYACVARKTQFLTVKPMIYIQKLKIQYSFLLILILTFEKKSYISEEMKS